ncbi:MAG TPA: DUF2784 domain-containing protein [Burkholderiaceae bacterium]|nr:DUF2784 domain-containing protein [Burkholderiaceae bacterium]
MGATSILALHLVVIAFNVAGCILIPVGALLSWRWVRGFWWRAAHLASLAVVAAQALLGRACFLTIWQADLANHRHAARPLIASWIDRLIYLPLPIWVFATAYVAIFIYVVALWVWVRPRRRRA